MLGGIGASDAHGMASVMLLCPLPVLSFSIWLRVSLSSAYGRADKRQQEGLELLGAFLPPPSPAGVTWVCKNVLGPVQPLSLLSIHGVSVSRSPRSLPDFHFKLCVLYVSPDGKISERSRCTLAGKGQLRP